MSISTCETIFSFNNDFPFDRSIKQAYPTIFAFLSNTNFEHSKLDFPVVNTSSTISTFWSFFIEKSLLSSNTPGGAAGPVGQYKNKNPTSSRRYSRS